MPLMDRVLPQIAGLVRRRREAHRQSSLNWIRRMESPEVRRRILD